MALLHSFYFSGDVTSETSSFEVAFILWMREEDHTRGKERKGRDLMTVMLLIVDSIQLVEYCILSSLYGEVEWCPPRRQCTVHEHRTR